MRKEPVHFYPKPFYCFLFFIHVWQILNIDILYFFCPIRLLFLKWCILNYFVPSKYWFVLLYLILKFYIFVLLLPIVNTEFFPYSYFWNKIDFILLYVS